MKQPDNPLDWWDRGEPRKIVAIAFLVALFFAILIIFPDVNQIYDKHPGLRNFLTGSVVVLGLVLSFYELKHSGEANDYRAEQNRLTETANEYREKNTGLQQERLGLQIQIHQLQESIERKLTKVRLYAVARLGSNRVDLFVSNLSEFDLWINEVELTVTEGGVNRDPETRVIGGGTRLSRGQTDSGYTLYGSLVSINGNRIDRINMRFQVKIVVVGVTDDPATIYSPKYQVTLTQGVAGELKVLKD
jgi:hypothetical protein